MFSVNRPVWQARQLLKADLGVYEHKDTGILAIRAEQYSIPMHINDHLDYVGPLTMFTHPQSQAFTTSVSGSYKAATSNQTSHNGKQSNVPASCNPELVTSQCMREFYNMANYTPQAADQFFLGVTGFGEEYANFDDFNDFLKEQRHDAYKAGYNFTVDSINGGLNDQNNPGGEANMDVQTLGGISFPIPFTFYSVGGRGPSLSRVEDEATEPDDVMLSYLLGLPCEKLPKALSSSYGDNEQMVSKPYAQLVCNYIMALGARGVSTIFASGDAGVGGGRGTCVSNGNGARNGTAMFVPTFPASCPYATVVGATQKFAPEEVGVFGDQGASAGGFSNYFATPWYQKESVEKYIDSLGDLHHGLYNRTGRGFPDVAVQGTRILYNWNGSSGPADGTSLSAPAFAGVVALLNDVRISQGRPSLGFLNPLIYGSWLGTPALNDITTGSNVGCNTTGFPALPGWDAASGAGSPNFEAMKCSLYA